MNPSSNEPSAMPSLPAPNPVQQDQPEDLATGVPVAPMHVPQPTQSSALDGDVIEVEWVQKVETVFRDNMQDPYELAKQFNGLKVQYLGQRYGKTLGGDARNRHNG